MQRTISILITVVLAATALAGCTDNGDEPPATTTPTATSPTDPFATTTPVTTPPVTTTPSDTNTTPPLDSDTYALEAVGFPAQAKPGQKWNFTLYANGSVTHESDHIGAHYADNDTAAPNAGAMKTCEHVAGDLPGVFTVNCTVPDVGTWFVYGHARINDSGELRNWWAATPTAVKVRDYQLNVSGLPTTAVTSGSNFTFELNITGSENATSNHLGAHFWNATEANPTAANSAGACAHQPEAVGAIGTFTVTCSISDTRVGSQTYYLRGHLRLTEGGTTLDWWSAEHEVSILGNPLG